MVEERKIKAEVEGVEAVVEAVVIVVVVIVAVVIALDEDTKV